MGRKESVYTLMLISMIILLWYDKNQVSNQGEYTNPTELVKTEETGMD